MGARVFRQANGPKAARTARQKEALTIWAIIAAVGLPLLLAYILMAADIRTDLSELRPAKGPGDPSGMLIGWPDLEEYARHPVGEPDARVRMLGYMMDGYQTYPDGAQLQMFILMPEAGQFLHPAHRVPNEMVEVWLGQPVPFKFRALVWVSGILQRTGNSPRDEKASWAMRDAETERAEQREITRWFAP